MNDITKKWNGTGLLEGLDEIQKDECAAILNRVAQIVIRDEPEPTKKDKTYEEFCEFGLPMARRIYDCLYPSKIKFPDIEWFVKDCSEFFNRNTELYHDLENTHMGLDGRVEMCLMYEYVCLENMNK